VLWVGFYFVLRALGSWGPAADAWILTGSILATYGMARGWTEFWLIWIAVDAVGVPLLLAAQLYPSAIMYLVYAGIVLIGFFSWRRIQRQERPADEAAIADDDKSGTTLSA
jgi:nicotinamide mononucleotide transporter